MQEVQTQDSESLRARVRSARRRSWEAIAVACIVLLYAVGSDLVRESVHGGTCQSRSFLLSGSEGMPQGTWKATENESWFLMNSPRGNNVLRLASDQAGAIRMSFFSAGQGTLVNIGLRPDGSAVLAFYRKKAKPALAAGMDQDGQPFLSLFDAEGNARFSAQIGPNDAASLEILDDTGNVVWRAP